MDKEQLQKELTQCKVFLSHASESKDFYDRMVAEAEAKLAEAEKPELRHGDYGFGTNWKKPDEEAFIYTDQSTEKKAFYASGMGQVDVNHVKHTVLGNIFDDLAALSQDMTEFDRNDIKPESSGLNHFGFKINGPCIDYSGNSYVSLSLDELGKLIRNLQIMYATMKRQKNG